MVFVVLKLITCPPSYHVVPPTPTVEEAGVLSFAADNLDVLINLFGFIAIEPAKIAIPAVRDGYFDPKVRCLSCVTYTIEHKYIPRSNTVLQYPVSSSLLFVIV